jgi:hypothetical protein
MFKKFKHFIFFCKVLLKDVGLYLIVFAMFIVSLLFHLFKNPTLTIISDILIIPGVLYSLLLILVIIYDIVNLFINKAILRLYYYFKEKWKDTEEKVENNSEQIWNLKKDRYKLIKKIHK